MAPDLLSKIHDEIDERLRELRPLLAEYEGLLVAADAIATAGPDGSSAGPATVTPTKRARRSARVGPARRGSAAGAKEKPARAARGVAREAILAALEHGSHTVGELTVVTAMSGPSINGHVRRLVAEGVVVKTQREGKTAWSLSDITV